MKNDIAIVSGNLSGKGGTETVISYIGKSKLIKNKKNITLFVFDKINDKKWLKNLNFNRVITTNLKNKYLCMINYALFLIKFSGDELLITDLRMTMIAFYIRKIFRKKYKIIFWYHFTLSDHLNDKRIFMADYYFAISSGIKNQLLSIGVNSDKISVIFNPINKKEKTILPANKCKFIYMARVVLDGQKNLRGLLNSLRFLDGEWTLDLYGSGPDMEKTEQLINDLKLNDKINLMGWVADPWSCIKEADALLLNSNYEGFGMVLAESISYGLPAISSDCPTGPDDIIKNGINGYLYSIGDYKKLNYYLSLFVERKVNFNHNLVKNSISYLYGDQYDEKFLEALDKAKQV